MTLNNYEWENVKLAKTALTVCHATDDRLNTMDGHPSFPRILITILIVAWGVL